MKAKSPSLLLLILLILIIIPASPAWAIPADYQRCIVDQACPIGEFLYDDNYLPITDASCTISSRYPNGTVFINAAAMTANADGWYSYSVNTLGATTGLYRTQVCCDAEGDHLCIDKSFTITEDTELTAQDVENAVLDADLSDHTTSGTVGEKLDNTSTLTAPDIWSYTNRSLTGFGTLVADIWGYTTRSLTSFGTLVTDIWEDDNRTLTTDVATDSDINNQTTTLTTLINRQTTTLQTTAGTDNTSQLQAIQNQLAENRTLLEQLLNDPIFTTGSDPFNTNALTSLLDLAAAYLNQLYANTQSVISQLGLIDINWDLLSAAEIADELTDILAAMGNNPSAANYSTSIVNHLSWFNTTWANTTTDSALNQTTTALNLLNQILSQVDINNKTADSHTDLQSALTSLVQTESLIGHLGSANTTTLYGLLNHYRELADTFRTADQNLANLLSNWTSYNQEDLTRQVNALSTDILAINLIPQSDTLLTVSGSSAAETLRNRAIALKALINLNQQFLANTGQQPLQTIWLETDGDHIVFRSAIFNPSASKSQSHSLKYFLPKEISLEDILSLSGNLTKQYDPGAEKTYLEGNFSLSPREVLLQSAVTTNFWHIPQAELDSLKNQAAQLVKPLEGTSYFTPGTQLKSDIDVKLALIQERQSRAATPENQIMAFRQNLLDMQTVQENLAKLNDLVTQANSSGTLMGFIGGIQAVSIWGIVIIIIVGVVGITLYMRYLHREELAVHGVPVNKAVQRSLPLYKGELEGVIGSPNSLPLHRGSPNSLPLYKGELEGVDGLPNPRRTKPFKPTRTLSDPHQKLFHTLVIGLSTAALAAMAAGSVVTAGNFQGQTLVQQGSDPDVSDDLKPETTPLSSEGASSFPNSINSVNSINSINPASTPSPDNITILGTTDQPITPLLTKERLGEVSDSPGGDSTKASQSIKEGNQGQTLVVQGSDPLVNDADRSSSTTQTLTIPPGERYNLRSQPRPDATILTQLSGTIDYQVIESTATWVNIKLPDQNLQGWLHHDLLP